MCIPSYFELLKSVNEWVLAFIAVSHLCAPYLCIHTHLLPTRGTSVAAYCSLYMQYAKYIHIYCPREAPVAAHCSLYMQYAKYIHILSKVSGVCIRVRVCVRMHALIPNVSACSVHTTPQALSLTSKMLQYSYKCYMYTVWKIMPLDYNHIHAPATAINPPMNILHNCWYLLEAV